MKHLERFLSLALALVLCLGLAACGESNSHEDYGDDDSDYNLYGVPDSIEGLVKDSEQMANLYLYGGAWTGEDNGTLISATSDNGDEVRFALYDADEELTASGFIQFVPEYDYDYFYNEHDGIAYRSWFDEDGALYVADLGTFTRVTGDAPGENIGDTVNDFSGFEGIWLGEANNDYDSIEFDADGNWTLYLCGEAVDDGYLRYEPEWDAIYAYSSRDDSGSRIAMQDGQLYTAAYGYFNPGEGMEYLWYEDGSQRTEDDAEVPDENTSLSSDADSYWSWDSDLCQRNVSEFEGIWYYDGDLSSETYIVIDGNGSWSYYQRAPGAEPAEMDCGTFSYSTDEVSTYYADSTMYDGVSYCVFELDEDALVWGDEGVYYLME